MAEQSAGGTVRACRQQGHCRDRTPTCGWAPGEGQWAVRAVSIWKLTQINVPASQSSARKSGCKEPWRCQMDQTCAEVGGYLQATGHTELATWAQNSERTATGPIRQQQWCNCTKTETEPRRGAGRGERAMRAGLKEEDISCCRVVQSQKAAVRWTEERHTRLGSDQSSDNLTDRQ